MAQGARGGAVRAVWLPALIFLLICGGWSGYWLIVRAEAVKRLEATAEAWRTVGYEIAWSGVTVDGFPHRVRMTLGAPSIKAPPAAGAWSWRAQEARVHALPYALNHIIVEAKGVQDLDLPGRGKLQIEAKGLRASIVSDFRGVLRVALVSGEGEVREAASGVSALKTSGLQANLNRNPDDPGQYAALTEIRNPRWPAPSRAEPPAAARLEAMLSGAGSFIAHGGVDESALRAWAARGGELALKKAELEWPDAALDVTGAMRLLGTGEWDGGLSLTARHPAVALRRLAGFGVVDDETAAQVGAIAQLAAGSKGAVTVPAQVRAGVVSLYGVPLLTLPPAY